MLTFDPMANIAFKAKVEDALAGIQAKVGRKLCLRISAGDRAPQPSGSCLDMSAHETAVVQVYLSRNGEMIRHFSSHAGAFDRPIPMGSISKVAGIVSLAEMGAKPEESWCARQFFQVRNAGGFAGHASCTAPESRSPAIESVARSDTLAILNRLRQLDDKWLRNRLLDAGVANVPHDHHPGISAATGGLEFTPRQVLEMFYAIAAGDARRATFVKGSPLGATWLAEWTARVMAVPSQARYVRTLLAAPADHARGTAHHLRSMLPPHAIVFAKTGTSEGMRNVTGKFLAFSVTVNDAVWAGLAAVQSPRPDRTLGQGLQHPDFASLHALLAAEISSGAQFPPPITNQSTKAKD